MKQWVSRFEWRILLAILLAGLAPFLISLLFLPELLKAQFALSVHQEVRDQLQESVLFYKDFFDSKKREFVARTEAIARDPVLLNSVAGHDATDLSIQLTAILADNPDLLALRIYSSDGTLLAQAERPVGTDAAAALRKTFRLPMTLGESPLLESDFTIARRYLEDRAQAENIADLYETAIRMSQALEREHVLGYIAVTSVVLLMTLALGYLLARQVTRRVAALAHATDKVRRGQLEVEVPAEGRDEITELTRAFNRMVHEAREARDRIVYLEKVSGWQDFARRLAHEIKNPLTPIRLVIDELRRRTADQDHELSAQIRDMTDVIEEEMRALTRLVDDFHRFARLPEVVPEVLALGEFVREFLNAYGYFEDDADIVLDLPAQELECALDRVMMRHVLTNLIQNAIEASRPRRPNIWIAATSTADRVELTIEDDGLVGVNTNVNHRLDPYFTSKASGGLGFAIAKKIVLQHGGQLTLADPRHGGARFVIHLPNPRTPAQFW